MVVILFKRGEYNLSTTFDQIFNYISLGSFPFEKWLSLSLDQKLISEKDLTKYRILIILELEGFLVRTQYYEFPVEDCLPVKYELQCKLHYNLRNNLDTLYDQFRDQIETEFERQAKHKISKHFVYNLNFCVKVIFESTGR